MNKSELKNLLEALLEKIDDIGRSLWLRSKKESNNETRKSNERR